MYIYDPSVSGLDKNDDGYMGDESLRYRPTVEHRPEYRLFQAAGESVELYYTLFRVFVVNDPATYRAVNLARLILEARTHLYVMNGFDKDSHIYELEKDCLLLWPDQPPIGDRDEADWTALYLAEYQMRAFINKVLTCLVFAPGFDMKHENRIAVVGLKELSGLAHNFQDQEGRDLISECFELLGDVPSDEEMKQRCATQGWVISRSETIYMWKKYGRQQTWENVKTRHIRDLTSLSFDDSRCEVLWKDEPIKGLNHEMHYRGLKCLFDARGEIVSNADLHKSLKPNDPVMANASGFVEASPQIRDFKTQVNKQLSVLPFSVGNVPRVGYSLDYNEPKRTPQPSHDVHTTNIGSS